MAKYLSTSSLAKRLGIPSRTLFDRLVNTGLLVREGERWCLTQAGTERGGQLKHSDKYGNYVVWPDDLDIPAVEGLLSLPSLAERASQSAPGKVCIGRATLTALLGHLGWLTPADQRLTDTGRAVGGVRQIDPDSAEPFTLWPESVLEQTELAQLLRETLGLDAESTSTHKSVDQFRSQFDAKYLSLDHHYLRSLAELRLDNWLYLNHIAHSYERPLPFDDGSKASFYLPAFQLYLELSDRLEPEALSDRLKHYQQHKLQVIVLSDDDLNELDHLLPRRLRLMGLEL